MGYTKHYYMGSERIATSIGGGGFCNMTTPIRELTTTEYQSLSNWQNQLLRYPQTNIQQTYNLDIQKNEDSNLQYVEGRNMLWNFDMHIHPQGNYSLCYLLDNEYCDHMQSDNVYYYHSDHLGSASWITNVSCKPIQYVHYGPYGELIANQTPHGYDERYKFTGKERDYETGYDYFGARNLCPAIGHWLSVDPLAHKYPWISSYAYCAWNPIKYVDATGKEPNKKLMGTSAEFRLLLDNSTRKVGKFKGKQAAEYMQNLANYKITRFKFEPTQTGYFNNKKGRYIYTKKGGWIDMVHFLFYAGKAYKYKCSGQENPVETAISDGKMQETMDQYIAPHSAYSYEDLPSDAFGAYFGANYFDPSSDVSFGEQVEHFLNEELQATEYYSAPNFDALPEDDKSSSTPSKTNTTTTPVYTIE